MFFNYLDFLVLYFTMTVSVSNSISYFFYIVLSHDLVNSHRCICTHTSGVGVFKVTMPLSPLTSRLGSSFPLHGSVCSSLFLLAFSSLLYLTHLNVPFFLAVPPRSSEEGGHRLVLEVCTLRGSGVIPVPGAAAAQRICTDRVEKG